MSFVERGLNRTRIYYYNYLFKFSNLLLDNRIDKESKREEERGKMDRECRGERNIERRK